MRDDRETTEETAAEQASRHSEGSRGTGAGEYRVPWWWAVVVGFLPAACAVVAVVEREMLWSVDFRSRGLILLAVVLGWLGVVFPGVRRVRWDQTGLAVSWYLGRSRHYRWDELTRVTYAPTRWWDRATGHKIRLTTVSGDELSIDLVGRNWAELLNALRAYVEGVGGPATAL